MEVFESLLHDAATELLILDDLCLMAAEHNSELVKFVLSHPDLQIVACHPRAVRWLLYKADIPEAKLETFTYIDLKNSSYARALKELNIEIPDTLKEKVEPDNTASSADLLQHGDAEAERNGAMSEAESAGNTASWFPVIDYQFCTSCGACMDFCLFGVFDKTEDGKITVAVPENCKDFCPACARICPHNAVIFPKYNQPPINGEITEDDRRQSGRKPLFALSGDELYAALSNRSGGKKRKNKGLYKEGFY